MTTTQADALPELPEGVTLEDLLIPLRSALNTCHDSDWTLRQFKTHITHALAALAALQSQPAAAGVSDAEIDRAAQIIANDQGCGWPHIPESWKEGFRETARAILALRPQAVPMTDEQASAMVDRIADEVAGKTNALLRAIREAEAHHGITAQGEDLWCIHISGPDEVHAAPSKAAAEHMAARHNQAMDEYLKAHPMGEHGPSVESVQAKVIRWPHAAQAHADEMRVFDWVGWGITEHGEQA